MKVGFIGLGSMGLPMAQRLLAEGHELSLYARRETTLEPFAGEAVTIAATPSAMDPSLEAVGICVFDAAGVEEVLFGDAGLVETLQPGCVVLVHSTVSPEQIREIAERAATFGLRVLDAPVSGGAPRAIVGELTIMVGGETETIDDVRALLDSLSNHVVRLGGLGAGSQAKLINNTMFSAQLALADDALRAGASLGVDPEGLAAILLTSSSSCIASGVRLRSTSLAEIVASPGFAALIKDVALMADALGEQPGHELVDVAQRFVAAAKGA
jgi:3-hydroxyisobutyrate dehydrogenase-like beta-hydroxyacid dehydrogenase